MQICTNVKQSYWFNQTAVSKGCKWLATKSPDDQNKSGFICQVMRIAAKKGKGKVFGTTPAKEIER
jgi:hypothetical protein